MRSVSKTVYKFSELDDRAKERAREWFRVDNLAYDWWEFVYDDAATIASLFGLDLMTRRVKQMDGKTRYDINISFSGFCSQGDGACFEGHYSYAKGSVKKVKDHAPQDKELHSIVERLYEAQRKNFYGLQAEIRHTGHYSHKYSMSIDVSCDDENRRFDEDSVIEPLRDFAGWIYERLEAEHDYLMSDEVIDESMETNEYEFDEDGFPA